MPDKALRDAVLFTAIEASISDDGQYLFIRFRDEAGETTDIAMHSIDRIGELCHALAKLERDLRDQDLKSDTAPAVVTAGTSHAPKVRGAVGFCCRNTAGGGRLLDLQTTDNEVIRFVLARETSESLAEALATGQPDSLTAQSGGRCLH